MKYRRPPVQERRWLGDVCGSSAVACRSRSHRRPNFSLNDCPIDDFRKALQDMTKILVHPDQEFSASILTCADHGHGRSWELHSIDEMLNGTCGPCAHTLCPPTNRTLSRFSTASIGTTNVKSRPCCPFMPPMSRATATRAPSTTDVTSEPESPWSENAPP